MHNIVVFNFYHIICILCFVIQIIVFLKNNIVGNSKNHKICEYFGDQLSLNRNILKTCLINLLKWNAKISEHCIIGVVMIRRVTGEKFAKSILEIAMTRSPPQAKTSEKLYFRSYKIACRWIYNGHSLFKPSRKSIFLEDHFPGFPGIFSRGT